MKIVVLDTETTGNKAEDRVCQLSYLVLNENLEIEEIHNELVKPEIPIKFEAMAVHHITNEMVEDAPKIKHTNAWKRLKELNSAENLIVIHNAPFDLDMLKKDGFNSFFKLIDTNRILRHLDPEGKFGLQYNRYALGLYKKEDELTKKYDIEINAHDALGDVIVLKLLLDYLKEKHSFEELIEMTKQPILYTKLFIGKHKFKKIEEVIIHDPDYIEYLLEGNEIDDDVRYSINYYLEHLDQKPIYKFQVGKYKGMVVEDVAEFDMSYINWAYHNMKMSKGMRERLKEVLGI